jgi:UMF1 family MFS transporter
MAEARADPGARARISWAFFDWAQQPYFMMVVGFIYGPWFAAEFFGDPVRGQATYGLAIALTGVGIAVLSPVIGAAIDARRNPKTWLGVLAVPFLAGCIGLWFAEPGVLALAPWIVLAIVASGVATELSINTANAMLPYIAAPGRIGALSGWSTGLGYFGGLLATVAALFVLPGLLGLDDASGETARIAGPLSAAWYAVFILPAFLFVPPPPPSARVERPLAVLWSTLKALPRNRTMLLFLVGRMLLGDGANAAGAFGPVLARGLFGWSTMEVGVFGLMLAFLAGVSCWVSGRLDDRWGSKRTLLGFTALLALAVCGFGLIEADRLFFLIPVTPPTPGDGVMFSTVSERLFLACGVLIAISFGPTGSVLRTWMARLTPPGEEGRWFGLFGLSGRATAFAAPALIGALTAMVGDQRVMVPVVLAFLLVAALVLVRVPAERD